MAVGGLGASGSGSTLTVVGLNGSYELSASTIYTSSGVRWISNAVNLSTSVTANGTFSVTYSEQFEVTVLGAAGGSVTPLGVQWVAAGTTIDLAASANSSSLFLEWNGTGSGNYTGSSATATVTVTGPVTEQVAFGPQPVPQKTSSTSPASGQAMALALLVVLLVVGLVIGLLVGRRRSPPPMAEAEPAGMTHPEHRTARWTAAKRWPHPRWPNTTRAPRSNRPGTPRRRPTPSPRTDRSVRSPLPGRRARRAGGLYARATGLGAAPTGMSSP